MRTLRQTFGLLVLALLPALILPPMAQAATFVYDAGAGVAIPKTDYQVNPSIPSSQKIVAADWNQLGQAAYDLRQAILTGYYHGLTAQTATPPAPAFGIIIYDMLDGGGLWAEFPDAGTEQVFDGLQQMDNAWVRAAAGIDGGLIVGHGGVYVPFGDVSASEVDFNTVFPFTAGATVTIAGDAANGATAVGVILNNDQTLSTAGARIVSFRNNNAVKAYVDYGGLGVFDGGVDLGVAGALTNANSITTTAATGLTLNSGAGASATPFTLSASTLHTSGLLWALVNSSNGTLASVDYTGKGSFVGLALNASLITGLSTAFTASTDGAAVTELELSIPGFYPAVAMPAANQAIGAWLDKGGVYSQAKEIAVTFVSAGSGCSGNFTAGVYDPPPSGTVICSSTFAASSAAGTVTTATCSGGLASTHPVSVFLNKNTAACTTWPAVTVVGTVSTF